MARDRKTLITLRHLLRTGRATAAATLMRQAAPHDVALRVEDAILSLLQFEEASEVEVYLAKLKTGPGDSYTHVRCHLAQGICANRLRDPLAALSWFRKGLDRARPIGDAALICELLLERAKVHVWMANFTRAHEDLAEALALSEQAPNLRLHTFLRYADLYAEAEQWQKSERFLNQGMSLAVGLKQSVIAWQFHLTAIAVALAQEQQAPKALAALAADQARFPPYLRFRFAAAAARHALAAKAKGKAAEMIKAVETLCAGTSHESFEKATLSALQGEDALLRNDAVTALPLLTKAREWYEKRELAVPAVRLAILEANALMVLKRPTDAARLLTRWRASCARRGLQVQREALDLAQQRHGLPRMAEIEQSHVATEKLWNVSRAYVLQAPLGQGGQGTVYAAHDTVRDVPVAYKKLALPPGPEAFNALRHEVEALCEAQVPGVARIIACGTAEDGVVYLVQELVPGTNLRKAQLPDVNSRLRVLAEVAATLDQLHDKGLAHGDIKPENIVLRAEGSPVLVDFSAARFQKKRDSQNAATPAYLPTDWRARFMSPRHRDQYAFGLILLEALTNTDHTHRTNGNLSIRTLMNKTDHRPRAVLKQLLQPLPFVEGRPLQPRVRQLLS